MLAIRIPTAMYEVEELVEVRELELEPIRITATPIQIEILPITEEIAVGQDPRPIQIPQIQADPPAVGHLAIIEAVQVLREVLVLLGQEDLHLPGALGDHHLDVLQEDQARDEVIN